MPVFPSLSLGLLTNHCNHPPLSGCTACCTSCRVSLLGFFGLVSCIHAVLSAMEQAPFPADLRECARLCVVPGNSTLPKRLCNDSRPPSANAAWFRTLVLYQTRPAICANCAGWNQLQDTIQSTVASFKQLVREKKREGYCISPLHSTILSLSSGPLLLLHPVVFTPPLPSLPPPHLWLSSPATPSNAQWQQRAQMSFSCMHHVGPSLPSRVSHCIT